MRHVVKSGRYVHAGLIAILVGFVAHGQALNSLPSFGKTNSHSKALWGARIGLDSPPWCWVLFIAVVDGAKSFAPRERRVGLLASGDGRFTLYARAREEVSKCFRLTSSALERCATS